jgi:hypothetical protein
MKTKIRLWEISLITVVSDFIISQEGRAGKIGVSKEATWCCQNFILPSLGPTWTIPSAVTSCSFHITLEILLIGEYTSGLDRDAFF